MTTPSRPAPRGRWVVWSVGMLVYVLAVFHRSSLGVAGLTLGNAAAAFPPWWT